MTVHVIKAKNRGRIVDVYLDEVDALRLPGKVSIGSHGYPQLWTEGRTEVLQRWVLGLKPFDGVIADHVNGNPLDNRRANLRVVDPAKSSANVAHRATTPARGVRVTAAGRYEARAKKAGRHIALGTFATLDEAAQEAHAWRVVNLPGYTADRESVA